MKHFILNLSFLLAVTGAAYAQNPVPDTHPEATISAMDYNTGQETQRFSPASILFKDALVDLCTNTLVYKFAKIGLGHKTFVITQLDPNQEGNTYELAMQRTALGTTNTVITFKYNIDQNALFYYNPQVENYVAVAVTGANVNNLNNCATYAAQFNVPPPADDQQPQDAQQAGPGDAQDAPVTATVAPPALLDDPQPECPTDGYLWQPGNWVFNAGTGQYQWVAGVWAAPEQVGFLWTPSYWAFENGVYLMHAGYWGATVGFYGGLNFGYGFYGDGFVGGRWEGAHFMYNTAVLRVNVNIHSRYEDRAVVFHGVRNRAGFNGRGGIVREPSPAQRAERATREREVHARAVAARPGGQRPGGARPGAPRPGGARPGGNRPAPQFKSYGPQVKGGGGSKAPVRAPSKPAPKEEKKKN